MIYNANNVSYNNDKVRYDGLSASLLIDYSNLTTVSTSVIDLSPASFITVNKISAGLGLAGFASYSVVIGNDIIVPASQVTVNKINNNLPGINGFAISETTKSQTPAAAEVKSVNISTSGSSS